MSESAWTEDLCGEGSMGHVGYSTMVSLTTAAVSAMAVELSPLRPLLAR